MQEDTEVDLLPIVAPEDVSDAGVQPLSQHTVHVFEPGKWNSPVVSVIVPGLGVRSEPGT
jgi:hypothetical protein